MKIRILENSGWDFVYIDGKLRYKNMLGTLDFVSKVFKDLWITSELVKFNDYAELDDFLESRDNAKRFVFRDDDYIFTPFELYKKIDPAAKENFIDVAKYLLENYKYKEEEYDEILRFIM